MRVRAFAKINLSLHVLGTRRDGYHDIRTVFQSIGLHDTLLIRRARGPFVLTCDRPDCPVDRTNLIWRAAEAAWRAAGLEGAVRGLTIHLVKRIPMQAGLGGGSSDAAATIRALGKLWRLDLERQQSIAASVGADVPYFLEGGTVLGIERGDLLFPLEDRAQDWVVLAWPPFGVSTRDAYRWFDREIRSRRPRGGSRLRPLRFTNDLEPVVARRHPAIRRIVAAMRRRGALQSAMSGSGSAVFGLFAARAAAARAAAALAGPEWRTMLTRTLNRRSYRRLAGK